MERPNIKWGISNSKVYFSPMKCLSIVLKKKIRNLRTRNPFSSNFLLCHAQHKSFISWSKSVFLLTLIRSVFVSRKITSVMN